MSSILVIGKNGYISSRFQEYMKRYPDIQIDAITARNDAWHDYDFSKYDAVFNTIGLAHDDARKGTDEQFMVLNRDLPYALACKAQAEGVKTFIHMSSMIVYGEMSELDSEERITSQTIPHPAGVYGESKLAGEALLLPMNSATFHVAIIRSPLVYSEYAVDNFLRLTNYATKFPIFPDLYNTRSMIYSDNLCELVKLIAESNGQGLYYPQQEEYIHTSKLVKDIANAAGHKLLLTKVFNPILRLLSHKVMLIRKVFGSLAYDMTNSDCFDGRYRVVSYSESIERLAGRKKNG